MNHRERVATRRQTGVGLIEILVAVLVLSVGFLYTASMQVRAMRANQAAYHHSQALMLAGDMMDRMRANTAGVASGAYDGQSTATPVAAPTCLTTGCTPAQLAAADLYDWRSKLVDVRGNAGFVPLLPPASDGASAIGSIALQAGGDYAITLDWSEFVDGSEASRRISVRFVP